MNFSEGVKTHFLKIHYAVKTFSLERGQKFCKVEYGLLALRLISLKKLKIGPVFIGSAVGFLGISWNEDLEQEPVDDF